MLAAYTVGITLITDIVTVSAAVAMTTHTV